MLLWLILGALLAGAIGFTVSYILTRFNILDTIKDALDHAATDAAKRALALGFKAMIKEKKENVVKIDVLIAETERLEVTINSGGISSDVYDGMRLEHTV